MLAFAAGHRVGIARCATQMAAIGALLVSLMADAQDQAPIDATAPQAAVYCAGYSEEFLQELFCATPAGADPADSRTIPFNPDGDLTSPAGADSFDLLGASVPAGQRVQVFWSAGQSFAGAGVDTPVHIVHGLEAGPVVCLFAAVHGDEINGIEIVRQVMNSLNPDQLRGTVVGVPIVNLLGFSRGSRYLPDGRDLNRYFPGNPRGSAGSRIAYLFFEQIVTHCRYIVDFHTGSSMRSNLPQIRADLTNPAVREFTGNFGATTALHNPGMRGMLRREATAVGIPTVTFELGEPSTVQPEHVGYGVRAIETLLEKLAMVTHFRFWSDPQPVYYRSRWVRADRGGILITITRLGARVAQGDLLGTVTNPITNESMDVRAPFRGRVLGMALNQFVLPGFAAFHIGVDPAAPAVVAADNSAAADVESDPELAPTTTGDEHEEAAEVEID